MRRSTKLAIGCAVGWLIFYMISSAVGPHSLDDENFMQEIINANLLQGIGSLLLIVAIISIIVTIYKNIMDKHIEQVNNEINANNGAMVATGYGTIVHGVYKMSNYNNNGQVAAMGENAKAKMNNFRQENASSSLNIDELKTQLGLVRGKMKEEANPDNLSHDEAIGKVASAERALSIGDSSTAIRLLTGAGSWAASVASNVAAKLVEDAIAGKLSG